MVGANKETLSGSRCKLRRARIRTLLRRSHHARLAVPETYRDGTTQVAFDPVDFVARLPQSLFSLGRSPRIHSSISREAIEQQLAWAPAYGRTGMVREKFMPIPSLSCLYLGQWRMRDISPSPLASSRHARIIRQPARCQLPE